VELEAACAAAVAVGEQGVDDTTFTEEATTETVELGLDIEDLDDDNAEELVNVDYESDLPSPDGSDPNYLDSKEHGLDHHHNERPHQTDLLNLDPVQVHFGTMTQGRLVRRCTRTYSGNRA
jgi:hypothetical protein